MGLWNGEDALASWSVSPTRVGLFVSPPFRLPAGVTRLSLLSDGSEAPLEPRYAPVEGDNAPFSLWVSALTVVPGESVASREADDNGVPSMVR